MDITSDFKDCVHKRRKALGLQTPTAEILPKAKPKSKFAAEAHTALQAISTTAAHIRATAAGHSLDGESAGLSEAELDEIDGETQHFLSVCGKRLDTLKRLAVVDAGGSGDGGSPTQLETHRQATMQLLYERLSRVASVFGEQRGQRLRKAAQERDQRLGSAAEAAGAFAVGGSLAPEGKGAAEGVGGSLIGGGLVGGAVTGAVTGALRLGGGLSGGDLPTGGGGDGSGGGSGGGGGAMDDVALEFASHELLDDDDAGLDAKTKAQLQMENETLKREFETMADQAKEAETRMLEISNLSHLFASKVEQQSSEVELLYQHAEATAENLVRGNAYIDSASRHARDFRLIVLTFLLVATFALIFLDWYTP